MPFSQFDIIMNGNPPTPPSVPVPQESSGSQTLNTPSTESDKNFKQMDPSSTRSPHPHIIAQPSIIYNHQIQQYSPGYSQNSVGPYQVSYNQAPSNPYSTYMTYGGGNSSVVRPDAVIDSGQHVASQYQHNPSAYPYNTIYEPAQQEQTMDPAKSRHEDNENDSDLDSNKLNGSSKKQRSSRNASFCEVCQKTILRDMKRHMRIHEDVKRFTCVYPRDACVHKTGCFNRNYDFKKHLLHSHFEFDDHSVKKLFGLNEKLSHRGTCPCGLKTSGGDWLDNHILTDVQERRCPELKRLWQNRTRDIDMQRAPYHTMSNNGTIDLIQPPGQQPIASENRDYTPNLPNDDQLGGAQKPYINGYGGSGYYTYPNSMPSDTENPTNSIAASSYIQQMQQPSNYQPYSSHQQSQQEPLVAAAPAPVVHSQEQYPNMTNPYQSFGNQQPGTQHYQIPQAPISNNQNPPRFQPPLYHHTSLPVQTTIASVIPQGSSQTNYQQRSMSLDVGAVSLNHPVVPQVYHYTQHPPGNFIRSSFNSSVSSSATGSTTEPPSSRESIVTTTTDRTSIIDPVSRQHSSTLQNAYNSQELQQEMVMKRNHQGYHQNMEQHNIIAPHGQLLPPLPSRQHPPLQLQQDPPYNHQHMVTTMDPPLPQQQAYQGSRIEVFRQPDYGQEPRS